MKRSLILACTAAALTVVAVGYTLSVSRPAEPVAQNTVQLGHIMYRNADGIVASQDGGSTGLACHRFASAADSSICLKPRPGLVPLSEAVILDGQLREKRRIELAGVPSRAKVSASGRMVNWTVFVTGESYNASGFSTWTGILDTQTGYMITNMETIPLTKDGKRYHSADVNYWGVTFAADDNRFYATVSTRGETYLVEGDYGKWSARVLRSNVECPSLSPDGKRIAFKKRVSPTAWRLAVLDLATMTETMLPETASIDDQAMWLDNETVLYAKGPDVWASPLTGAPRLFLAGASSPNVR